jgi:chloramphenicol 3-O-phosphotransferase
VSEVTILGGPPGAGKSTVAEALCAFSERSVHLEADKFLGFIRAGGVLPWLPEAQHQNETAARAAARSAAVYASSDYDVVVDGFIRPWSLEIYRSELSSLTDRVHFVMLLPDLDVVVRRGTTRADTHGVPKNVIVAAYPDFVADGLLMFSRAIDSIRLTFESMRPSRS